MEIDPLARLTGMAPDDPSRHLHRNRYGNTFYDDLVCLLDTDLIHTRVVPDAVTTKRQNTDKTGILRIRVRIPVFLALLQPRCPRLKGFFPVVDVVVIAVDDNFFKRTGIL